MSEASEPFTPDEVQLILEEANGLGTDPQHLVEFLFHFGIHPSRIPTISPDDMRKRRVDGTDVYYLVWERTKPTERTTTSIVEFPVMPQDALWLPDFLERTPYGSRWSVDRQLTRIQERLKKRGYFVNVCALRFRHTCCVFLLQRGLPEVVIRRLLRITSETLETYGKFRFETTYRTLLESNWGSPEAPPLHSPRGL